MERYTCRYTVVVLLLICAFGLAGTVVAAAQGPRHTKAAIPLHGVSGKIEEMQVVVHHGEARSPSHVYSQFSTTQVQHDGDFLVIEGRLSEATGQEEPADITITLRTTPHHDERDAALYDAQRNPVP